MRFYFGRRIGHNYTGVSVGRYGQRRQPVIQRRIVVINKRSDAKRTLNLAMVLGFVLAITLIYYWYVVLISVVVVWGGYAVYRGIAK